jgi:hypothetical protein
MNERKELLENFMNVLDEIQVIRFDNNLSAEKKLDEIESYVISIKRGISNDLVNQ